MGVLAGHTEGITYIDPKGDGRYFISNGKDQTVRLWDMRKMGGAHTQPARPVAGGHDYRFGPIHSAGRLTAARNDYAIMAYRGHSVHRTLVRAKWSPCETTGQRYIYSGSGDGTVHVWDALTGQTVSVMRCPGRETIVRDVAWHPHEPTILATTWNASIERFSL